MQSSTLSRTSSAASISSDDAARRTRKRFTSVQLMMLEQLFHQSSHPTREEREAVAQAAGMEMKSVTIWFQNKRQTERKVALHHATNQPTEAHRAASFPIPSSSPSALSASTSSSATSHPIRTPHTRTLSTSHSHSAHAHTPRRKITPPRPRPSLDRVATRSESRLPPPRTPTRPHNPRASLWDNMPSSPLAPPSSPPSGDLIQFMGSRTLEWACAAARLAGKEGRRQPHASERDEGRDRDRDGEKDGDELGGAGDDTEEDDVEAVTPEGSLGASDVARWRGAHARVRPRLTFPSAPETMPGSVSTDGEKWSSFVDVPGKGVPQDEDMMRAALALCGLGRRSG
ncbi:homeobox-domain-containing protein [Boletus coccyginus]|nr:homeobox-domain-containing protein [Boletus coccyginus]